MKRPSRQSPTPQPSSRTAPVVVIVANESIRKEMVRHKRDVDILDRQIQEEQRSNKNLSLLTASTVNIPLQPRKSTQFQLPLSQQQPYQLGSLHHQSSSRSQMSQPQQQLLTHQSSGKQSQHQNGLGSMHSGASQLSDVYSNASRGSRQFNALQTHISNPRSQVSSVSLDTGNTKNSKAGKPASLKNFVVSLQCEDDRVNFIQFSPVMETQLVSTYVELLNNDGDTFYLKSNFPGLYADVSMDEASFTEPQDSSYVSAARFQTNPSSMSSLGSNSPIVAAGLRSLEGGGSGNRTTSQQQQLNENQSQPQLRIANGPRHSVSESLHSVDVRSNASFGNALSVLSSGSKKHTYLNSFPSKAFKQITVSDLLPWLVSPTRVVDSDKLSQPQQQQQQLLYPAVTSLSGTSRMFCYRIVVVTKFKLNIEIGFAQLIINSAEYAPVTSLTISKIYIAPTYRKLHYDKLVIMKFLNLLFDTYPRLERVSASAVNQCQQLIKFNLALGFRLDRVKNEGQLNANQVHLLLKKTDYHEVYHYVHQLQN